ncbi:activator of 2-hydroxyglutaryl-CoA dehydratase [Candidatus Scalindua japonica]|uniref:Activator of 2-hydroxyglutaryl-CoA dehydratase n=1 Tax=Candidatus Scalindua japonica TaxID=1284222 RepID=A0A286TTC9_9BACT|nr:acyl-CoA dehydratase activase [Candidatus Scalindua japonica]GAX59137.1 activator of 2-hydroxyglutaryl-CoA dehydratase [Candidatus Scalindua japonica]
MNYYLGIDIGSATTDVVLVNEEKTIVDFGVIRTSPIHKENATRLTETILKKNRLSLKDIRYSIATGYGRYNVPFVSEAVTEITCHAKGILCFFPNVRSIIDIGGQDSKVIVCDESGNVKNFAMNDKCAAGSGRFLEVLAGVMNIPLSEMGQYSLKSEKAVEINSTCTVFAESEVISKLAMGVLPEDILSGVFNTLAKRVYALGKRFAYPGEIAFSGGVARNVGVAKQFECILETNLNIAVDPDITGALGAGLYSIEKYQKINNGDNEKVGMGNSEELRRFSHEFNSILARNPLGANE